MDHASQVMPRYIKSSCLHGLVAMVPAWLAPAGGVEVVQAFGRGGVHLLVAPYQGLVFGVLGALGWVGAGRAGFAELRCAEPDRVFIGLEHAPENGIFSRSSHLPCCVWVLEGCAGFTVHGHACFHGEAGGAGCLSSSMSLSSAR
jgi:hypothetical protein